jgi:hypothetical protein
MPPAKNRSRQIRHNAVLLNREDIALPPSFDVYESKNCIGYIYISENRSASGGKDKTYGLSSILFARGKILLFVVNEYIHHVGNENVRSLQ